MRRYTSNNTIPDSALFAWQALGNSVYQDNPFGVHSLILRRPGFGRSQGVSRFVSLLYVSDKEFFTICIIDQL